MLLPKAKIGNRKENKDVINESYNKQGKSERKKSCCSMDMAIRERLKIIKISFQDNTANSFSYKHKSKSVEATRFSHNDLNYISGSLCLLFGKKNSLIVNSKKSKASNESINENEKEKTLININVNMNGKNSFNKISSTTKTKDNNKKNINEDYYKDSKANKISGTVKVRYYKQRKKHLIKSRKRSINKIKNNNNSKKNKTTLKIDTKIYNNNSNKAVRNKDYSYKE